MCCEDQVQVFDSVGYTSFLIPGLVMMSVLQNAFANSSSSLIQSKITGNLVFLLVTPLSHWAWFVAYVGASVVRGLVVGAGRVRGHGVVRAAAAGRAAVDRRLRRCSAPAMLGALGLIAGLWAEKFDQMAAFQNFIIMPMTFLSGVFYSVHSLPPFWQAREPPEPVLLHDRRLPARLLRRQRCLALAQPGAWWPRASSLVVGVALHLLRSGYKIELTRTLRHRHVERQAGQVQRVAGAGVAGQAAALGCLQPRAQEQWPLHRRDATHTQREQQLAPWRRRRQPGPVQLRIVLGPARG